MLTCALGSSVFIGHHSCRHEACVKLTSTPQSYSCSLSKKQVLTINYIGSVNDLIRLVLHGPRPQTCNTLTRQNTLEYSSQISSPRSWLRACTECRPFLQTQSLGNPSLLDHLFLHTFFSWSSPFLPSFTIILIFFKEIFFWFVDSLFFSLIFAIC